MSFVNQHTIRLINYDDLERPICSNSSIIKWSFQKISLEIPYIAINNHIFITFFSFIHIWMTAVPKTNIKSIKKYFGFLLIPDCQNWGARHYIYLEIVERIYKCSNSDNETFSFSSFDFLQHITRLKVFLIPTILVQK